ncbi:hypothetical protein FHX82_000386 [Amycolatopsis bartoniae]|uniref:Uncharacterized protein n=1 Tax=Amycolatopsis bartoniae TaxID=941986 RepID=A0A8H9IY43_9PSEU|nr:hypothetical protein [Amycolatopsis bartoniae]MBB2933366.1 hypothetical protein [Amycolatopsis bartoniae]TVT08032.1 hypothetical protein FNH07_13705 [Amycolatopsis bartoniae]GHF58980.1 hypothetical protein GCM10017566_35500 [Amycolatopsis bartoniae]
MSPVSRGRRTKPQKKKPALDAGLRAGFDEALEAFAEVAASDDVLDVELLTAEVVGSFWLVGEPEAATREVGFPLVGYAASRQSAAGFALLCALQALSPGAELRERARAAAARLAALGMKEPSWAGALSEVTVVECHQQTDVYGDQSFLLFRCERGGREHALVVETDRYAGVLEAYLTTQHEEILAELDESSHELLVTGPVPLARARRVLEDAMAVNDGVAAQLPEPAEDDPLTDARVPVLARLRAMPEAEPPAPARQDDGAVEEFLATAQDVDAEFVHLLAEFGEDVDEREPLHVSPGKFEFFFDELLHTRDLDDKAVESLRDTLLAWAGWQGPRQGLSAAAVEHLLADVEDMFDDFFEHEREAEAAEVPPALRG